MKFHNPFQSPPMYFAFSGEVIPEDTSSFLSKLTFRWLGPLLDVGYSRPLEAQDLWKLPQTQLTESITDQLEGNFYSRCRPAQQPPSFRNRFFSQSVLHATHGDEEQVNGANSELDPLLADTTRWLGSSDGETSPRRASYDGSLLWGLYKTFYSHIWISGFIHVISQALRLVIPLLNKWLLAWLTECYVYHHLLDKDKIAHNNTRPPGIGYGVGLAFASFTIQGISSLMSNNYLQKGMITGLLVRTGIIGNIFRKSLRLSERARSQHGVGQITTLISSDTNRLDQFCGYGHNLWVSPIQVIIGMILLVNNLGYAALVGFVALLLVFPVQSRMIRLLSTLRKKGVKQMDDRVRLMNEVLQGIRLVKAYAWETFYAGQIGLLRAKELDFVRRTAIVRAGLFAVFTLAPLLASVLSFIAYALLGNDLNIAIIFSSLQLFNLIREPLAHFPATLSSLSDALVSISRIQTYLVAEELAEPLVIDKKQSKAVHIDGTFVWEYNKSPSDTMLAGKPFKLSRLRLDVARGSFIAIIGRIGSGKSSILQALIGEMRRTDGEVIVGSNVAYVPQTPWLQNATLRENVTFGGEFDSGKFFTVIRACGLEKDLKALPHNDETELGERGVNLSGGQKARVSLARAAYSKADIVLLDDPLSSVDVHVGKHILNQCLLHGPLAHRTRILATHSLHFLDQTDYIYVVDNGLIIEEGSYEFLQNNGTVFAQLFNEHSRHDHDEYSDTNEVGAKMDGVLNGPSDNEANFTFMKVEERTKGSVSWQVYKIYLYYARAVVWGPIVVLLVIFFQLSQVGNNLFLGFWASQSIAGFGQNDYITVYTALGVAQGIFFFLFNVVLVFLSLTASSNLFKAALTGLLRSPISFFDTTPLGRVVSRLSKDQDVLDSHFYRVLRQLLWTLSSVFGAVALIFYTFPLLGIVFAPIVALYYLISIYYRRSSLEINRLNSLARSSLYGSYYETLTGLPTIRAYREQDRFIKKAERGLDTENQAYYVAISIQQWLSVRLDLFNNILVLSIALFATIYRHEVHPVKTAVLLSYTLSMVRPLSELVQDYADYQQSMNSVERVVYYSQLPPESEAETPEIPPISWPNRGHISFTNVGIKYREDLPLALHDITFQVHPGEKIGIVGRTGAGKSSLLQALFRFVELHNGRIDIDGYNTSRMSLDILRGRLALVPQESTLFLGTLRENLDPQKLRTDAELIAILQRAWLLPIDGTSDPVAEAKFSLDSTVSDGGSNFSAGEKQLLALCRALVKQSRIVVLDEATSSVDVGTDAKIQQTIQREFANSTLLCIAHRLHTIAYYDRVLVMDNGKIAEFDTVLNLYDKQDSIFRTLCNEAKLGRTNILRIRALVKTGDT